MDGGTQHSTSAIESTPQTATVTKNRTETSIMEKTITSSDLFVRFFQMEGLSLGVSEVIMASWRPGMKRVYNRTVQRWLEYCRRWGYHTQHPTVSEVLDFLHALFTQGLGYSAKIAIVVLYTASARGRANWCMQFGFSVYERCF